MRYVTIQEGLLVTAQGETVRFEAPEKKSRCGMSWRQEEREGVLACYVSGHAEDGLAGQGGLILHPEWQTEPIDYMAIHAYSPHWCRPIFGTVLSELPTESRPTQALLTKQGDRWGYRLCVCDDLCKTEIFGCENGFEYRVISGFDGMTEWPEQLAFVYAEGDDPFEVTHRAAKAVAVLLDNGLRMREERVMPEMFEYLGWCSWDALQIRINHEGLLEKAREFKEKQVPVRFAILDDMWADCPDLKKIPADASFHDMVVGMHSTPMHRFEGDPDRFPKGMKAAIEDLKAEGIPTVGVWFPVTGYWAGFTEDGEAKEMEDLLMTNARGQLMVIPTPDKAFAFYDRLCRRVRSWGGDFVKIDNQSFHRFYKNQYPVGPFARAIHNALDSTTGSNFNGALINCMGMATECLYNRRSSAVNRCSGDFMPENRSWFAGHILQCSYNGLLQGQYYVNDWDMWWTDDEQAIKNSVCRAISGGPIYVSDKIGRTNPEVLRPLVLDDGRILRADESATPTADCLMDQPRTSGRIFKVRNRVGANGLIAAFNLDDENRPVSGTVGATDAGLPAGAYAYYEYFTGEAGILGEGERLPLTLEDNDVLRLYTFVPYEEDKISVIGRLDKMIGVAAVKETDGRLITLSEGGSIGLVANKPPVIEADGKILSVHSDGLLHTVEVERGTTHLYLR